MSKYQATKQHLSNRGMQLLGGAAHLDADIEALDLAPAAKAAAYALRQAHPEIVFTSGRRDKAAQARAMAGNIIRNPRWVAETYKPTPACAACQKWVDEHPQSNSQSAIQAGLLDVFESLGDEELGRLSKHLSGEAFDVQPMVDGPNANAVKASIRALSGLGKFLEEEGGLVRWHVQF